MVCLLWNVVVLFIYVSFLVIYSCLIQASLEFPLFPVARIRFDSLQQRERGRESLDHRLIRGQRYDVEELQGGSAGIETGKPFGRRNVHKLTPVCDLVMP